MEADLGFFDRLWTPKGVLFLCPKAKIPIILAIFKAFNQLAELGMQI
jgi:hypothetical protein